MSEKIIDAVTKNRQSEELIRLMTEKALSKTTTLFSCKELAGGLSNAVYLIETEFGKMVLKIASDQFVITMRHEKDYVSIEASMLKLFQEQINIPAPQMIYFDDSKTICPVPYFFMTYLDGTSLSTVLEKPNDEQIGAIKYQIGTICRQISSIQAPCFGIPAMPSTYTNKNSDFIITLFSLLLEDAADKNILIPDITGSLLLSLIGDFQEELNMVKNPCYVHTDTWDGNVLIKDNQFRGLVDYAGILYGDELMNHDFHDFSPTPVKEFLKGYGKTSFTKDEWSRIVIYKIWQRLGMIVECGFRQYVDPGMYSWVNNEFVKEIENLKKIKSLI